MKKNTTSAVLVMAMLILCGCREETTLDRRDGTRFNIERSMQRDPHRQIQFGTIRERDEKNIALDLAADRWNRNMYIQNSHASLGEYVEKYGQNP